MHTTPGGGHKERAVQVSHIAHAHSPGDKSKETVTLSITWTLEAWKDVTCFAVMYRAKSGWEVGAPCGGVGGGWGGTNFFLRDCLNLSLQKCTDATLIYFVCPNLHFSISVHIKLCFPKSNVHILTTEEPFRMASCDQETGMTPVGKSGVYNWFYDTATQVKSYTQNPPPH